MENIINEGVQAASKDGIEIPHDYISSIPDAVVNLENFKTSMLQDIQKGKNPEIDGILKPVMDRLESAPYCETLYRILHFKYGKKFIYTPKLTVDVIVENEKSEILLIKRKNPPHGWALPGGFVDYGEKVESAAARELFEETNIKITTEELHLLGVYSDPARDPRGHTVSIVYYAKSSHNPTAADDAAETAFFEKNKLPSEIVFDHKQILSDYLHKK
jgi:2-dehydropantoate 2-reductase